MSENEIVTSILEKYRTIAIVGLSRDPAEDSHKVAEYLKANCYRVIPINPFANEILGEKCYRTLLEAPENVQKTIEVVNIFRPAEDVPPIVDQAIRLKQKHGNLRVVWMQLGIVNEEAAELARNTNLTVIMDRCMMIEHKRFIMGRDNELKKIWTRKRQEIIKKIEGRGMGLQKKYPDAPITVEDATFNQIVQQYPLMVIDCWAAWCGPCRMIAPIIDEMARDYAGKVVFGKLNVDENMGIAMRFEILSIPTLLIMRDGKEVERIVGAVPKQLIEAKLRKYM